MYTVMQAVLPTDILLLTLRPYWFVVVSVRCCPASVPLLQQPHSLLQQHCWPHLLLPWCDGEGEWTAQVHCSHSQLESEWRSPLPRWGCVWSTDCKPDSLKTQSEDLPSQLHWWPCLLHLLPTLDQWRRGQCQHSGGPTRYTVHTALHLNVVVWVFVWSN